MANPFLKLKQYDSKSVPGRPPKKRPMAVSAESLKIYEKNCESAFFLK